MDATCFERSGWGTEGTSNYLEGQLGGRAVSLNPRGHTTGDRKRLEEERAQRALAVVPGQGYTIGIRRKSTAPVSPTLFRHSAQGWSYSGDVQKQAPAADCTLASTATPTVPDGTDCITFGLSLGNDGTPTTDDYSLTEIPAPIQSAGEPVNPAAVLSGATHSLGCCPPEYGADAQSLPAIPPSMSRHLKELTDAGLDPTSMPHPWTCAEVRSYFKNGIAVREARIDPQKLDTYQEGVACGPPD